MILSPIPPDELDAVLIRYLAALPQSDEARGIAERIALSRIHPVGDPCSWHRSAVELAASFGMRPLPELPSSSFSWDGRHVRTVSEPAVLIHEVAHFQLASPARRFLPDFGLGAGPETGCKAEADRVRCVDDDARELEERMASLLGVLWEVELGQPGIAAFQEQNWLEGAGRASTAAFLVDTLERLERSGLVAEGRPLRTVRITPDR